MKKFLLATTVAVAALSTGFAVSAQELSSNVRTQIMQYVPDANLDNLSATQIAELNGLFINTDNLSSGGDPAGVIMQVLDGSSARSISQVQLTSGQKDAIRQTLPAVTDAQLENLSTSQMARLAGLWTKDNRMDSGAATEATLQAILIDNNGTQLADVMLTDVERTTILGLVPEAQLDSLTVAQTAELTTLLADSSRMSGASDPAQRIRSILGQ